MELARRSICAILASVAVFQVAAAQRACAQVSVTSYNIRYLNKTDGEDVWPNRKEAVIKALKGTDLIGLQEVVHDQLVYVRESLPEYEWYGAGRDDGKQAGEYAPLGWRKDEFTASDKGIFWMGETPGRVGSKGWDAALPRVTTWARLEHKKTGLKLLLLNTHFDHRGKLARENSATQIRKWVADNRGDAAVILTGDFNATKDQTPIKNIVKKVDGLALLENARDLSKVSDPGPNSTWNGFKAVEGKRRIDFIFTCGLGVQSFETLNPKTSAGRFASDHLPVQAVVSAK